MVVCKICGYETENSLQPHINQSHKLVNKEYLDMYPKAEIYSKTYGEKLQYTNAHRDPIYKKKLSENTKRLYRDTEWVKKHNEALKKGQTTKKARENHRKGALKYYKNRSTKERAICVENIKKSWKDPLKRKNRVDALKLAHNKPEVINNHSRASKKFIDSLSDQEKENRRQKFKDIWAKPENRKKILELSKIGLKAAMSPRGRANFYKALKNLELREKRRQTAIKNLLKMPVISNLNKMFKIALNKNYLYPVSEFPIGPYVVDFCFPKERIIIEVDGDYWHANPGIYDYNKINQQQKKIVAKDKRESTFCKNHGWKLLRFWETDIKKDISSCIEEVRTVLYGKKIYL